ncbi:SAV_2336 N-terminal domain-related protein [Streptomyces spongiicola]|uniref:SAV_2336 N-terminal domain-related protein n=1 Tax=Streptomyces spongiicola TaxID=1690221 RepID=UPI000E2EF67B|nr:SAV_2336 N-terminal domain-related protein [Streptomyces spongiicola]
MADDRLRGVLRVLRGSGLELDPQELLDVLWLAGRLPADERLPLNGPGPDQRPAARPAPDTGSGTPNTPCEQADRLGDRPVDDGSPALHAAAQRAVPSRPDPVAVTGGRPREKRAMPLRVPEDKALRDELLIGRALRPLKQRRPSLRHHEVDEAATAAALAETGLPDVVTRPARERWLHLVLLVDDGLSMLLWHRLVAELRTLMQRLGAFRSVRVHGLDSRRAVPSLRGQPFDPSSTTMSPSVLTDPSGQTLILVVSDGMGAAWRTGSMHDVLQTWSGSGPVSVVHALPTSLWEGSGIQADRWQATTRRRGSAGASWTVTDRVLPPGVADFTGIPVPVLEPTARSLGDWAHLIASPGTTLELPLLTRPRGRTAGLPQERGLQRFRDAATPEAYRLAAHVAAVSPVSVPVMRLVLATVPWRAGTAHLAEVFLGGVLRPSPAPVPGPLPPQHRVFDFPEEAKGALLDAVPSDELLRTGRSIGRRLEQLAGRSPDFPAWLVHPDGDDDLPEAFRSFSVIERRLLARLGVSLRPTAPLEETAREERTPAGTWAPLTPHDPARIGPYRLTRRRVGRRTIVYLGQDDAGAWAAVRVVRPDMPPSLVRLLATEAEALERMDGRYAPRLLGQELSGRPAWTATELAGSPKPHAAGPPRLADVLPFTSPDPRPPLDVLTSITLAWHLAGAVSLCHLKGLHPADLSPESIVVLDRSVMLMGLSDCSVDGEYTGEGPPPDEASSVQALGDLLRAVGSKENRSRHYLTDGMELWQGDTWAPLRELVLRCVDHDPGRRPSASEVAAVLARYVSIASALAGPAVRGSGPPRAVVAASGAEAGNRVPLEFRPAPPVRRPAPRIGRRAARWGPSRTEHAELLERIRTPLGHSRHVTLVGAHPLAGRSTTTIVLGSVLASVRDEPVLALDGAPARGELSRRLSHRNRATLREAAALPGDSSYEEFERLTSETPHGLQVLAHSPTHTVPSPAYTEEYRRIMAVADRHYPMILTDWAPPRLDRTADAVLELTDRVLVCCNATEESIGAAAARLAQIGEVGYPRLAADALVIVTRLGGGLQPLADGTVAVRLLDRRRRPVIVPFDHVLASAPSPALGRLRPATADAYTALAAALVDPPGPGTD